MNAEALRFWQGVTTERALAARGEAAAYLQTFLRFGGNEWFSDATEKMFWGVIAREALVLDAFSELVTATP